MLQQNKHHKLGYPTSQVIKAGAKLVVQISLYRSSLIRKEMTVTKKETFRVTHRCIVIVSPGGFSGFWPNSFQGVIRGVRKFRRGPSFRVLLHFMSKFYEPYPFPLCTSMGLLFFVKFRSDRKKKKLVLRKQSVFSLRFTSESKF